jgi:hypothetical protein
VNREIFDGSSQPFDFAVFLVLDVVSNLMGSKEGYLGHFMHLALEVKVLLLILLKLDLHLLIL